MDRRGSIKLGWELMIKPHEDFGFTKISWKKGREFADDVFKDRGDTRHQER